MNLSDQLNNTALQHGEKTAYYFLDQSASYAELNGAVNKMANSLEAIGVKKGDHVGLLLGNSPHFIVSLYAALRIGATAVPINPIYTPDEIAYILRDGDVKAVVALDLLLPLIEKAHKALPGVGHYIVCETSQDTPERLEALNDEIKQKVTAFTHALASQSADYKGPQLDKDDTAVVLYTSGTTGKPKGAMLTHENIYSNAQDTADYLSIRREDRVIAALPMFHVFALTVVLNAPLMNGGTMIIIPRFSPKDVFEAAKKYEATVFAGVPTMYNFLLQYPDASRDDFKSVRLCISGGASLPVALLHSFEEKFNVQISEGYGLSEASPVTCFNPLDRERKAGSIGTSITNVENKIVNELGEELGAGEVGELIVRGPNVMKGYYKMPEETEAAIKDGWLYTGDLAKQDEEGYFFIVDRKKDMVIVGGYNVYPREVEEVLYNHEDIVEAAVVGVPDPDYGEAVQCFVVSKNPSLTKEEVVDYCSQHLAKYKLPTVVEFIEELPKNTTGKILRRALRDQIKPA
ncbi:fatty acid--CoA ligase family protein [Jeotgalibacillus proteolyticus]|uniref:Long-chain fatty acid--CoA ligase n=1 Tax=Jeotgalibacillus proteolyticus TaxID=2082395 RepID=A0A2S5GH57_9BACL|nr:fatty acid--CoA ligase family protein [Jeotgalibacillus proteolyticus]PPA72390.1 long-chain fatty acid--CoA ligase [Jeotgalibacillus proteolyticus]